jgi:hypothetical protein
MKRTNARRPTCVRDASDVEIGSVVGGEIDGSENYDADEDQEEDQDLDDGADDEASTAPQPHSTAIRPSDVVIPPVGILTNTLGKAEVEAAAATVVRYHHANGLAKWTAVSRQQLADFCAADEVVQRWCDNPFWRPYPDRLIADGWVDGWKPGLEHADLPGRVTEKFLHAIANPGSWRDHTS